MHSTRRNPRGRNPRDRETGKTRRPANALALDRRPVSVDMADLWLPHAAGPWLRRWTRQRRPPRGPAGVRGSTHQVRRRGNQAAGPARGSAGECFWRRSSGLGMTKRLRVSQADQILASAGQVARRPCLGTGRRGHRVGNRRPTPRSPAAALTGSKSGSADEGTDRRVNTARSTKKYDRQRSPTPKKINMTDEETT